jgi:hypothetical protein
MCRPAITQLFAAAHYFSQLQIVFLPNKHVLLFTYIRSAFGLSIFQDERLVEKSRTYCRIKIEAYNLDGAPIGPGFHFVSTFDPTPLQGAGASLLSVGNFGHDSFLTEGEKRI